MNTTPDKYIERLNELSQKKKVLLLDIFTLTQTQTGAISDEGLDSLNKSIEEKQLKIDAIEKIDEEFGIYFQRLKSTMGITRLDQLDAEKLESHAAEGAKQLKSLTAEILGVIQNISEIEIVNNRKSKDLLDEYGNQIKKINQGKKANNAYKAGPVSVPSYFMDKKK